MAETTPNYGLHQWTMRKGLKREELNEDLMKIDEALAEKADAADAADSLNTIIRDVTALKNRRILLCGQYVGTGESEYKVFMLYDPVAVLVESQNGKRSGSGSGVCGGMATRTYTCGSGDHLLIEVLTEGFKVFQKTGYSETNQAGHVYRYFALV